MSAIFRNQIIAGHTIGASKLFGAALVLITVALVGVNSYHMGNFLASKLTNVESSLLMVAALYVAGTGIAALEIPLGKSLVTTYRLHGLTFAVMMQGILAVVIASMAVFAGVSSQLADADRRDTQSQAYSVSASSFANMKQSAEIQRDAAIARASRIYDAESRNIAILEAKAAYQDRLVSIAQQEASNTLKKPVTMFKSESDEHYVTIMLFSIVCSFGALFCSGFSAIYVSPLVALPAFSLKAKANHDWQSDGSDFQSAKHELSPLANKYMGFLGREKVPARIQNTRPSELENSNLTSGNNRASENRPHVEDTRLGAVLNSSESIGVRTPNDDAQKGGKVDYSNEHYLTIKKGIVSGDIKPTVRPVKAQLVGLKVRFVDDAARQQKAVDILDQLQAEGVLIENPDFGKGGQVVAKFILNPNYQPSSDDLEGQRKKQNQNVLLEEPVRCICPSCGETEVIDTVSKNGKVKSACGAVYKYADNLADRKRRGVTVTPMAGAGVGISDDGLSPVAGIGAIISK